MSTSFSYEPSAADDDAMGALIARLAATNDSDIEAIGVGGSRASSGSADAFADLDVFVLVRNGALQSFIERIPMFAESFGRPLLIRPAVLVPHYGHSVTVIFAPTLCCQFNVNDRSTLTPHHCRKHTRILVDREGFLTLITERSANLDIDRRRVFEESAAVFWHRVIDIVRDVKRNQHWMAIRHLADARRQLLVFARLLQESDPLDYFLVEKRIEQDLGDACCREFAAALPCYEAESIVQSLSFAVTWVNEHAASLALTLGADYPSEAAHNISALVSTVKVQHG